MTRRSLRANLTKAYRTIWMFTFHELGLMRFWALYILTFRPTNKIIATTASIYIATTATVTTTTTASDFLLLKHSNYCLTPWTLWYLWYRIEITGRLDIDRRCQPHRLDVLHTTHWITLEAKHLGVTFYRIILLMS